MSTNIETLRVNYLHFLKEGVEFIQREENGLLNLASQIPLDKLRQLCDEDFSWSYLYELPVRFTEILLFAGLGLLPIIQKAINEGVNVNQAIIKAVSECQQSPDQFTNSLFQFDTEPQTLEELKNIRFGFNQLFSLSDIFALQTAMLAQVAALRKYGKSMTQLVNDVSNGKDESLFAALYIDPTALACTPVVKRMSLAKLNGNEDFFRLIGKALQVKWKKPKKDLEALRVILHSCQEDGILSQMSLDDKDRIFIQELEVYSNDGEDPVRSLARFIDRWKQTL